MREDLLRVGDIERRQVGELLSRHFADGRLNADELDERMGRAMGAKTRADLDGLLVDLPRFAEPVPAARRRRNVQPLVLAALALVAFLMMAALAARARVDRVVTTRQGALPGRVIPPVRTGAPPSFRVVPPPVPPKPQIPQ